MRKTPNLSGTDNSTEKYNPWSSYSDLITSTMFVVMLLLFYFMIQYAVTSAEKQERLDAQKDTISQYEQQIQALSDGDAAYAEQADALQAENADLREQLAQAQAQNTDSQGQLAQAQVQNADLQEQLTQTQTSYDALNEDYASLYQLAVQYGNEKQDALNQVDELETERDQLTAQMTEMGASYAALESDHDALSQKIETQQAEITQLRDALALAREGAEAGTALADQLAASEQTVQSLTEEKDALAAKLASAEEQTGQMEQVAGVRTQIVQSLLEAMNAAGIACDIDPITGDITLSGQILFPSNSPELTDEGKQIIGSFMDAYLGVLLSKEYAQYVAEIAIEGYTDSYGTEYANLKLSQQRALAVAEYCITLGNCLSEETIPQLIQKLSVTGCGERNQKYNADGTEDYAGSRRVEIKFRLTDEDMVSTIQNLMENNMQ